MEKGKLVIKNIFLGGWIFNKRKSLKYSTLNMTFFGDPEYFKKPNWIQRKLVKLLLGWEWIEKESDIFKP